MAWRMVMNAVWKAVSQFMAPHSLRAPAIQWGSWGSATGAGVRLRDLCLERRRLDCLRCLLRCVWWLLPPMEVSEWSDGGSSLELLELGSGGGLVSKVGGPLSSLLELSLPLPSLPPSPGSP